MAGDPVRGGGPVAPDDHMLLAYLASASEVGFWDWDMVTNALVLSSGWKHQIGYQSDEIPDRIGEFEKRVHPDDLPSVLARLQGYLDHPHGLYENEFRLRHKDGSYRSILARGEAVRDRSGRPVRMVGCHIDVTDWKQSVDRERASLQLSMELGQVGRWELDLRHRRLTVDDQVYAILGTTADAQGGYQMSLDRWVASFMPESLRERSAAAMTAAMTTSDPNYTVQTETPWRRVDGSIAYVSMRYTIVKDAAGNTVTGHGVVQDVSERRRTETRLKRLLEGESLLSAVSQSFIEMDLAQFDAVIGAALKPVTEFAGLNRSALFLYASDGRRVINTNEWCADPADSLIAELRETPVGQWAFLREQLLAFRTVCLESMDDMPADSAEADWARQHGFRPTLIFPLTSHARLIGALGFYGPVGESAVFDADTKQLLASFANSVANLVTRKNAEEERLALERQLLQSQKMEAIGTLAGGIAHDFNNILSAIVGNLGLARIDHEHGRPIDDSLLEIERASDRARALVQQILAFSRQQEHERQVVALAPVVEEATRLMRATIPAIVSIDTLIGGDTPDVVADPTQVHQILMNLCANAWHAMDDRPGAIVVELKSADLRSDEAARVGINPGRYARISVRDNGRGMDEETLHRVFDPFFTTKVVGRGTGLGMSVVHGIVRSHLGGISIDSEVGRGTNVHVYIPAASAAAVAAPVQMATTPGRGERILLVDDEEALVKVMSRILERLGYEVTACTGAIDALAAFRAASASFDLVITDFEMPDATGLELAKVIHGERAETPVILCSGRYRADASVEPDAAANVRRLITKPCSASVLSRVVRDVLDERLRQTGDHGRG